MENRNGEFKTRVEGITLAVPRHRNVLFKTLIFDTYSGSEATLVAAMTESSKFAAERVCLNLLSQRSEQGKIEQAK